MNLTLCWQGPLGPGRFPADTEAIEALLAPGVYLRIKRYQGERTVAYVGQSIQLLARIDQHLTNTLGLLYGLRDEHGRPCFEPAFLARLTALNDIETVGALALAEARRTQFYYALCDDVFAPEHLDMVEHLLMRRVEQRLGVENRVAPPKGPVEEMVVIDSDLSALAAEDQGLLADLIGSAPLALEAPLMEAELGG